MKCSNYRNLHCQKTDTDTGTLSRIAPGKQYTLRVDWPRVQRVKVLQNNRKQRKCFLLIGFISNSIFVSSDIFCLIIVDHITYEAVNSTQLLFYFCVLKINS